MARFDYEVIGGHMVDTPSITVALPQGGAYLLQCALTSMTKRWQWISGDFDLNDYQWDELDAILSELTSAIITEVSVVTFPIGIVVPFPVDQTPTGFLLCNGDQYLRVNYPLLYAVLAPAFIVDADNFTVPDLGENFIRGIGDGSDDPGDIGGADEVTLSVGEMPAHGHGIKYDLSATTPGTGSRMRIAGGRDGTNNTEIEDTGSDAPHNNLPPYMAMPYYIRAE